MTQDIIEQNLRSFIEQTSATAEAVLRAAQSVAGSSCTEDDANAWTVVSIRKDQSAFETLHITDHVEAETSEAAFRAVLGTHAGLDPSTELSALRAAAPVEVVAVLPGTCENVIGDVSPAYG